MVYDESQDFPKKRHALYGEALDVLLRKWASEKRIQRNPIYQELSAELELDMLAEIAYTSFVDDQLFFSKTNLIHQIRDFLVDNLNAPRHLDTETVLREIEIQQGILVERARDAYSFSHLTFQEYLTAKCIVDNNKIAPLVRDHATEQHWREVFLLVAGLAPGKRGADELLLAMERQAQTYISTPALKSLLAWATAATTGSPGQSTAAAKRIAAVFLDLDLALALALDPEKYKKSGVFRSRVTDNLIIALYQLKYSAPREDYSVAERRDLAQKIMGCFSSSLGLDLQSLRFSSEDKKQLENYFYTLELMIRCKEAAVRVSLQVWVGIEERMVTVPKKSRQKSSFAR